MLQKNVLGHNTSILSAQPPPRLSKLDRAFSEYIGHFLNLDLKITYVIAEFIVSSAMGYRYVAIL